MMDQRYAMPRFPYGQAQFPPESRQVFSGMGFGLTAPPDALRLLVAIAAGVGIGWYAHKQWKKLKG